MHHLLVWTHSSYTLIKLFYIMSEITHEIHPQQKRIAPILSKCKAELSDTNYVLIEKYDRAMVNETLGYATRIENLDIILSLSRMLRTELQLARFNERGTVEKKILTMDLFDAFIMTLHKLKTSRIRILHLPMGETITILENICNSCKDGNHTNKSHSIWIEEDEETRAIICKCDKCHS